MVKKQLLIKHHILIRNWKRTGKGAGKGTGKELGKQLGTEKAGVIRSTGDWELEKLDGD